MDCIVAPLYVTSDVFLRANTPIIFKAGEPNHITIKTKNINKDDHTGILLGGHPGDGLPRYIGVLLEGTMNIVAPFNSESATKVLEQLGIDFKNEAFTITQEETKLAPGQTPNRPLLGRALQREIAADDGNITIAIHVKRKIKAAKLPLKNKFNQVLRELIRKLNNPEKVTERLDEVTAQEAISKSPGVEQTQYTTKILKLKTSGEDFVARPRNVIYIKTDSLKEDEQIVWTETKVPVVPSQAIPFIIAQDKQVKIGKTSQDVPVFVSGTIEMNIQRDFLNNPFNGKEPLKKGEPVKVQFKKYEPVPVWGNGPGGFKLGVLAEDVIPEGSIQKIKVYREPFFSDMGQDPTQDSQIQQTTLNKLLSETKEQAGKKHDQTADALIYYMISAVKAISRNSNTDIHNLAILFQIKSILEEEKINQQTTFQDVDPGKDVTEEEVLPFRRRKEAGFITMNNKATTAIMSLNPKDHSLEELQKFKDFLKLTKGMNKTELSRRVEHDQNTRVNELRHRLAIEKYGEDEKWKMLIPSIEDFGKPLKQFNSFVDGLKA